MHQSGLSYQQAAALFYLTNFLGEGTAVDTFVFVLVVLNSYCFLQVYTYVAFFLNGN